MGEWRRNDTYALTSFMYYSRTFHPDNRVIEHEDKEMGYTMDTCPGDKWRWWGGWIIMTLVPLVQIVSKLILSMNDNVCQCLLHIGCVENTHVTNMLELSRRQTPCTVYVLVKYCCLLDHFVNSYWNTFIIWNIGFGSCAVVCLVGKRHYLFYMHI